MVWYLCTYLPRNVVIPVVLDQEEVDRRLNTAQCGIYEITCLTMTRIVSASQNGKSRRYTYYYHPPRSTNYGVVFVLQTLNQPVDQ